MLSTVTHATHSYGPLTIWSAPHPVQESPNAAANMGMCDDV